LNLAVAKKIAAAAGGSPQELERRIAVLTRVQTCSISSAWMAPGWLDRCGGCWRKRSQVQAAD
jgi:hypothetical protein